jgi:hypothetical protein
VCVCVRVCVCAVTRKVSILIVGLQVHLAINVLFVTQFKTWQFYAVWWDSLPVSTSTVLSAVVGRRR